MEQLAQRQEMGFGSTAFYRRAHARTLQFLLVLALEAGPAFTDEGE